MKLSAPKNTTFLVAFVAGVLGLVGTYIDIPVVSGYTFFLLAFGFVLLALANIFKGL